MHRPIFGHSFAVLVAPILLSMLAFKFLNKKKINAHMSGSMNVPTESESGESSSSKGETSNGASSGNDYEVFLSFRGPDTRNNFTDHLYNGLCLAGIHTFIDNEELRQGEKIGPNLLAAIKNSKILIPILSVNYGASKWCLDELVRIMDCKKNNTGHIILPVFYKVAPADVRYQKGSFGKAFHKHERRERGRRSDSTILEKRKQALEEVCHLKGWEAKGSEAELVKSVVQQVLLELKKKFELVIPKNLVGINSHVKKVMEFVDNNTLATLFVGIHGMGGIGKTTLAKTIYNRLSNKFEHRSFIADIRESCEVKGLVYLQNQLISDLLKQKNQVSSKDEGIEFISSKLKRKKVLILLDDLGDDDQVKALAGNHNWFSSGSILIITTRNKSILDNARVDCQYEHEELDRDNSMILFSRHAFRRDSPPIEFEDLTHDVISTTGGLPLSLEVLGSFLCGKEPKLWRSMIMKLKEVPHEKVQEKLRISYESLTLEQKQIFLDIACFFIGTNRRITSYMWEACGFFPEVEIEVLRFLSLIKVGDGHELIMHSQLRDLGRKIVCNEDQEPGKRSRLWDSKEALEVLEKNEGTEKIEAIHLSKDSSKDCGRGGNVLMGKKFKKLRNLRFLDVSGVYFSGDFKNSIKKLKWLQWRNTPSTFEATNFDIEELLVLKLLESDISNKWQGWSSIMMAKKLKCLNLTSLTTLENTSFLLAFENLEILVLRDCRRLEQIDSSIGNMKSLKQLDLTKCIGLKGLPAEVGKLEALEQLLLESCEDISILPDGIGALQNLEILNIRDTGIEQLPDMIGALQNLEILDISCSKIKKLPNHIGRLRKLRELYAFFCYRLGGEMPESICNLSSLQRLDLRSCEMLESVSVLPSSLTYLRITCQSRRLPSLSSLTHLKELEVFCCKSLECIWEHPTLPENCLNTPFELEVFEIGACPRVETLDVSQLNLLRTLTARSSPNLTEIRGLVNLKYLHSLEITFCNSIKRLDLPKSTALKTLTLIKCKNLVEIQGLNELEFLKELDIEYCASIKRVDLSKSIGLKVLIAIGCENVVEIEGINRLVSLKVLNIYGCILIEKLDLTKSKGLETLNVSQCKKLVQIQGLNSLEFLKEIDITGCNSIEKLDLPKSESLKIFNAPGNFIKWGEDTWVRLNSGPYEIQGLENIKFLRKVD